MVKRILSSIWFLALIITIPVIVIFPPVFEKYTVDLVSKELKINTNSLVYFYDLDNDGIKERIESFASSYNLFSFQCLTSEGDLIDQYNFPYEYHSSFKELFFTDSDDDNLTDVYGFTLKADSVFLSWVEPLDTMHLFKSKFITTISTEYRDILDVSVGGIQFFDLDGDNNEDIVFSLAVGYNLFPRKLFVFHPATNQLEMTENFGSYFRTVVPIDISGDGEKEVFCISSSSDNIPENLKVKYKDNGPRIFIFDAHLNIKYEPIEFPLGLASYIKYFFTNEEKGELIVFYNNSSDKNTGAFVTKLNATKQNFKSDTLFFNRSLGKTATFFKVSDNSFLLFGTSNKYYRIDSDLKILEENTLDHNFACTLTEVFDINGDNMNECFVINETHDKLLVFFENFKRFNIIEFEDKASIYKIGMVNGKKEFYIDSADYFYTYRADKNYLFYLKYPGYILIYLLSVLFIWLIQVIRIRQLNEKFRLQNQVRDLQMKSLKSQLDPHFMYNTFNTIASVIKQGRNEEAYDMFVLLSKMVRSNLDNSNEIYTTLQGELEFVIDYLSIQKFRFKELFEYQIHVEKTVNTELSIPKMLVQIHVENALKHGIRTLKTGGKIDIRISKEVKGVKIEIEDNGIGREKSKWFNSGKIGIGLKTIKQIIELNNQKNRQRIKQKIIDLKDQKGSATGTLVVLKFIEKG